MLLSEYINDAYTSKTHAACDAINKWGICNAYVEELLSICDQSVDLIPLIPLLVPKTMFI